jgi:hypothetical protein
VTRRILRRRRERARVKDQSHLEEMRAAVRGDRERAEQARQRSAENVRALIEVEHEPEPEPPAAPAPPERSWLRRFFGL